MKYLTQQLASYVAQLTYQDIPAPAIDAAKKCILDGAANLICGRYTHTGTKIVEYIKKYPLNGAREQVALLGETPSSLENVLLAHTVMSRCADLDDGSRRAMGHPGCVLVPTALAVGECLHCSGSDIIVALVAGYDIYIRVGSIINPSSYRDRGFDATGLCGAVAAAAVAAKLMKLEEKQIQDALGLAALFCGGLIEYQNDGTMGKTLCGAWAAQTGLQAARMAEVGFTGAYAALEGKKGFAQAFGNVQNYDFVLCDLGKYFCITEVYFKLHACMRGLHSAVDAILSLREEHHLTKETIQEITVWTTPFVQRLSNPAPHTIVAAQCSLEFCLAAALIHGSLSEEAMLVSCLEDQAVLELCGKIHCRLSEELQEYVGAHPTHWSSVCVEVKKLDNTVVKTTRHLPMGEPELPLSWETLVEKLERMTRETPCRNMSAAVAQKISSLENLKDISALLRETPV